MAKSKKFNHYSYSATSLEEILVYIVLHSILFLILFEFYSLITKKLNFIEQDLETAYKYHVADFFLRSTIMQAGYQGPASSWVKNRYNNISSFNSAKILPLSGLAVCRSIVAGCKNFVTAKVLNKIRTNQIKINSDLLLIYDIPEQISNLQCDMSNHDSPLQVTTKFAEHLNVGDQLIIADLELSQRFVVSNIINNQIMHTKPYNINENFVKKFSAGSEIFGVKHVAFYIAKNPRNATENYSLYMDYLAGNLNYNAHAIIDNVEEFKVKILDSRNSRTIEAADFGWIFGKLILIELSFKHNNISKHFTIVADARNV